MKKIFLFSTSFIVSFSLFSQSGAKFATGGNSLSTGDFFGSTNLFPIIFKVNNLQKMSLATNGVLQLNGLAGTGSRFLQADLNGNVVAFPAGTASQVLYGNGVWGNLPPDVDLWTSNAQNNIYNISKVGIGNNSPQYNLDVTGTTRVSTLSGTGTRLVTTDANGVLNFLPTGLATQYLNGSGTWTNFPVTPSQIWNQSGNNIYYAAGNVGINTSTPGFALDVNGDARISNTLYVGQGVVIGQQAVIVPNPTPVFINAVALRTRVIDADTIRMDSLSSFQGQANFLSEVNLQSRLNVTGNARFTGTVVTNTLSTSSLSTSNISVSSLANNSGSFVYADASGNLKLSIGGGTGTLITPCVTNAPWMIGGNKLGNIANAVIGTCDNHDFVMEANNNPYVFLRTTGQLGIGNNIPNAMLDITTSGTNPGFNISNNSGSSIFNIAQNGATLINGSASVNGSTVLNNSSSTTSPLTVNGQGASSLLIANNGHTTINVDVNISGTSPALTINNTVQNAKAFEVDYTGNTTIYSATGDKVGISPLGDFSSSKSFISHYAPGNSNYFAIYQGIPGTGGEIQHFFMAGGSGSTQVRTTDPNTNAIGFMVVNNQSLTSQVGGNEVFVVNNDGATTIFNPYNTNSPSLSIQNQSHANIFQVANDGNTTIPVLAPGTVSSVGNYRTLFVDGSGKIVSSSNTTTGTSSVETLQVTGHSISILNGSTVINTQPLPDNQTLTLSGHTLNILDGNTGIPLSPSINLPDNDNQTLTITGTAPNNFLTISGGGGSVALSALGDNLGNHVATQDLQMAFNKITNVDEITFSNVPNFVIGQTFSGLEIGSSPFGLACDLNITKDLTVENDATITGIATVGSLSCGGTSTITGKTNMNADVTINGDDDPSHFLFALTVNGATSQTRGVWDASDKRFKRDIKKLESVTDKIKKLGGYTYYFKPEEFKERNFSKEPYIGFIAQELKEVFPQLVREDAKGYLLVNYQGMIPVLVEAIKEQQKIIEDFQNKTNKQDSTNTALQNQLNQLASAVNECCTNNGSGKVNNVQNVELSNVDIAVLNLNVPNPFAEQTTITYNIPQSSASAQLLFYDAIGRVIKTVDITGKGAGKLNVYANDLTNGTYSYTLIVDGKIIDTKKMVKQQ